MRLFQIESFSKEVSLRNPEAALTVLASLLFTFGLFRATASTDSLSRNRMVFLALSMGTLPVLMFHARFRPKHPIELWHRMLAGGDAQLEAMKMARGGLRLDESDQILSNMIFPNAMGTLYRVHCVQGYSALQPPGVFLYPDGAPPLSDDWRADLVISESGISLTAAAEKSKPHSRFRRASDGGPADVSILKESHNSVTLDVSGHDPAVPLVRTDTYYPGWHAIPDAPVERFDLCFSKINSQPHGFDNTLTLQYFPSMSRLYSPAIGLGAGTIVLLIFFPCAYRRKPVAPLPFKS
jgi:hypothetical protein